MSGSKSNEKKIKSLKKQENKLKNNPKALEKLKGKVAGIHTPAKKK
jgi:hypothetical protein